MTALIIILELIAIALFATFGFWLLCEICEAVEFLSDPITDKQPTKEK